jgi:hypothetical protein
MFRVTVNALLPLSYPHPDTPYTVIPAVLTKGWETLTSPPTPKKKAGRDMQREKTDKETQEHTSNPRMLHTSGTEPPLRQLS